MTWHSRFYINPGVYIPSPAPVRVFEIHIKPVFPAFTPLVLELLCRGDEEKITSRWCFLPQSPLFKYGLITFTGNSEGNPLLTRYLKVDDRIVDFLLGFGALDCRLRQVCRLIEPRGDWDSLILAPEIKEPLMRLAGERLEKDSGNRPVFYFYGAYGSGRKTAAQAFCSQLQFPLLLLECRELITNGAQCEPLLRLFFREALLTGEAEPGSELSEVDIGFAAPDDPWRKKGNKLELNIYLYDIRENRKLRTNETQVQRFPNASVGQRKAPPRLECNYIITAWNKAHRHRNEDNELLEHRLLSQVLRVLMQNHMIPAEYLHGYLRGQEPALPIIAAQPNGMQNAVEFWNGLGCPARPSVICGVTLSMEPGQWRTGPMVVARVTDYMPMGEPGALMQVIQIGGRVTDMADPPRGISGAAVVIRELDKRAITGPDGYYKLDNLTNGRFLFEVSAPGFRDRSVHKYIPLKKPGEYFIKLSTKRKVNRNKRR